MPSSFPGMDPYLEHPELWPGVHHQLIVAIANSLSPQLRPKYSVSIEVRMYETSDAESLLVGIPNVSMLSKAGQVNTSNPLNYLVTTATPTKPMTVTLPVPITIRLGYLEIKEVATKEVVTSVEVLSPVNKRSEKGRDIYLTKREQVLGSLTNFAEIDLLHYGQPMPILNQKNYSHYRILVSHGKKRPKADLCAFHLQNQIPQFPLPLHPEDTEPMVDLQTLLTNIYDVGSYDLKIDYTQQPVPKLLEDDAAWADTWLQQQELK